jgi:uncharacterized protein (DUF885 family)
MSDEQKSVGDLLPAYAKLREAMTGLAISDCYFVDAASKLDSAEEFYTAAVQAHTAAVALLDQAGRFLHDAEDAVPLEDEASA